MVNIVVRDSDIIGYADEHGNRVIGTPNLRPRASITFTGKNNVIEFGENSSYWGGISFRRDGNRVFVGEKSLLGANFDLGADTTVRIGDRFNMAGLLLVVADDGCTVTIGDDSMISQNCAFRAYDNHPIFDLRSRNRMNYSRDITVGTDVWIGNDVTLSGGSVVGHGSIIGTRSVVTASRPIGKHCLAVGSPARVVKEFVAWEKPGNPPASVMRDDAHADCLEFLLALDAGVRDRPFA